MKNTQIYREEPVPIIRERLFLCLLIGYMCLVILEKRVFRSSAGCYLGMPVDCLSTREYL